LVISRSLSLAFASDFLCTRIHSLEALPEMVTEFSEELWGSLVDHVTVHSKDNIVLTLTNGMEIKA